MNLARRTRGLACKVEPSPVDLAHPILHWEAGPVDLDADDVLNGSGPGRPAAEREEALEWLSIALADGPRPARELFAEARADGITPHTLRNAKTALGVQARKNGFERGWTWFLPTARHPKST
jgi:hypothetical protein